LIALPLVVDMIVTYVAADRAALFSILSNPDKFTGAAPYTFLSASLLVLIFGPGEYSLDEFLMRRAGTTRPPPAAIPSRRPIRTIARYD
jgi:putative oxidoreductase